MEFVHHQSVLKSNNVNDITRTCHLTLCLDVHICLWCVFQIINIYNLGVKGQGQIKTKYVIRLIT